MTHKRTESFEVTNKIFTIANLLSIIRLAMIGVFLVLLLNGFNLAATLVFAIAASTDWIDGQVARKTNTVSRLGQLLDPFVDRLLMISGVVGLFAVGRIPLWIIVFVVVRDLLMLGGGSYLYARWKIRIPVIFLGKVATTCLYIGFAAILLNWPLIVGLGLTDIGWLPLFNAEPYSWGYWFVYVGLLLSFIATIYYVLAALRSLKQVTQEENREASK